MPVRVRNYCHDIASAATRNTTTTTTTSASAMDGKVSLYFSR